MPPRVTSVPTGALTGVKLVTVGSLITIKLSAVVTTPPGVFTVIFPVEAVAGTVAVIWVSEFTVKLADVAPKLTLVAPVKVIPVIVTVVPAGPVLGVKLLICGDTLKLPAL